MRHMRIAPAQADFLFLLREQRLQKLCERFGLKFTPNELHRAAVQLFDRAISLGDDILPHKKLVHAVADIRERQRAELPGVRLLIQKILQTRTLLIHKIEFQIVHADGIALMDARLAQGVDDARIDQHALEILERFVIVKIYG